MTADTCKLGPHTRAMLAAFRLTTEQVALVEATHASEVLASRPLKLPRVPSIASQFRRMARSVEKAKRARP